jgi:hypothetical protein
VLIEGGPADFFLFYVDGRAERITMGRDLSRGEQLIIPCPGNTYKAILLHESAEYLLTGSVVTPAWNPQRAHVGADETFVDRYAGAADWATPDFLRRLIGPNFGILAESDGAPLHLTIDADGQILWKNMQLTEEQLVIELRKFAATAPGQPLQVTQLADTPNAIFAKVIQLVQLEGIATITAVSAATT